MPSTSSPANILNENHERHYHYEFIGNPENSKTIAGFIAPATGRKQEAITSAHIPRLRAISEELGICFAYPVYKNGHRRQPLDICGPNLCEPFVLYFFKHTGRHTLLFFSNL